MHSLNLKKRRSKVEFKSKKGIFQQIADSICEKIIAGELLTGEKLPSVREQAALTGVNQNTIMRTYAELQRDKIVVNKRGIGYFVTEKAAGKILSKRKNDFFKESLPEFIKQVEILHLTKDDLKDLLKVLK